MQLKLVKSKLPSTLFPQKYEEHVMKQLPDFPVHFSMQIPKINKLFSSSIGYIGTIGAVACDNREPVICEVLSKYADYYPPPPDDPTQPKLWNEYKRYSVVPQ